MRRIIKIIAILALIATIVILGKWLFERRTAVQNDQSPLSFRDFWSFGLKSPESPATTDGALSSDFTTPPDETGNGQANNETGSFNEVSVSQFTSGPLTPAQTTTTSQSRTPSRNQGLQPSSSQSGEQPTTEMPPVLVPPPAPTQQCSDADVTISFTADEINRLNRLQNRFYAVAGMLRSDQDVANELANYDIFKAKSDEIIDLYNYCQAKSPLIATPAYRTRISTPYWRDPTRDGWGYLNVTFNSGGNAPSSILPGTIVRSTQLTPVSAGTIDPRGRDVFYIMQRIFRVNLW